MLAKSAPIFLLASPEAALLTALQPAVAAAGAQLEVVFSAEAALAALKVAHPPALALIDVRLAGMETAQLLAAVQSDAKGKQFPILLISDNLTPEWLDRMAEGVIDDLLPHDADSLTWQMHIDAVLRNYRMARELDLMREAAVYNAQTDHLTGTYNRETMLTMLFRETDRVQRMQGELCMILVDIDDFGHWNSRLGAEACDDLLCQVVERTSRMLRSYDLLGRPGKDEFLLGLPGCSTTNALMLADRMRLEVFSQVFSVNGEAIRLSACFGIASSRGRSPVVVLRETEQALVAAKNAGPESIQFFGENPQPVAAPVTYLLPTTGDELLAW
jgi:two-component system cell cycle response regulator